MKLCTIYPIVIGCPGELHYTSDAPPLRVVIVFIIKLSNYLHADKYFSAC